MVVDRRAWFDPRMQRSDELVRTPPVTFGVQQPEELESGSGCLTRLSHLVAIELALLIPFALLQVDNDVWRWWRDGERITGIVVEVVDQGQLVVRDPATELEHSVTNTFETANEGGDIEVIVSPKDPTDIATNSELVMYLVFWVLTVLAAVAAPLAYLVRRR